MAQYEYCLIMDGDVGIGSDQFLENYWRELQENEVVVGGHQYPALPPLQKEKYLHWLYGSKIEVQPIEERKKTPYNSFKTVCFGIQKSIFTQIKFDENIAGYGHEDTLFGIALEKQKINIKHINNPVIHLGIDHLETFLSKQKEAVVNLKKLYKTSDLRYILKEKSKLIKTAEIAFVGSFANVLSKIISKNIYSSNPKLWALQLQKIIWWKNN